MTCKKDKESGYTQQSSGDTRSEIRRITEIKHRKPNLDERLEQVGNIVGREEERLREYNRAAVVAGDSSSDYAEYLEQLGTYLIDSQDKESCRSIEYSYYQNDRRYGQYAIGSNTFPIDFSSSNDIINKNYIEDSYGMGLEDMEICIEGMSDSQVRRVVRLGMSERHVENSRLRRFMTELNEYIYSNLKDELDKEIYSVMLDDMNDREISEELNIPRSTVTYRVGKIVELVRGFQYE